MVGGTQWSGLGLRNASVGSSANITVTGYSQTGSILAVEEKTLVARGQEAFVFGAGLSCEGWILVASDQPLIGLDFFGTTGSDDHMADITLIPRLASELIVPHVAQNDQWDTTLMVCNPHAETNTLDLVFVDGSGNQVRIGQHVLPAFGSLAVELAGQLAGLVPFRGSVELSSELGVAAFALYRNLKWGGGSFAGISAVEPTAE